MEYFDQLHWPYPLKDKQVDTVNALLQGNDCFCVLPTGYGKSDAFALVPLLKDKVNKKHNVTIVVSPLKALMRDQVQKWKERSIKSHCILAKAEMSPEDVKDIENGNTSVIYVSPEAAVESVWLKAFKAMNIVLIAFDEVHCLATWGTTFRQRYQKAAKLRAVLGKIPVLATTATASKDIVKTVQNVLGIVKFEFITEIPNRSNIYLDWSCVSKKCELSDLRWYADLLTTLMYKAPKAIIFCRSIDDVTRIYRYLLEALEKTPAPIPEDLVEIFHSHLDEETEIIVPKEFCKATSIARCLVCTIAFGMGISVVGVEYVIHWKPSESVLDYWQEVGRCARDSNSSGKSFIYTPAYSINKNRLNGCMLDAIKDHRNICVRKIILQSLKLEGMKDEEINKCCGGENCCSTCTDSTPSDECNAVEDPNFIDPEEYLKFINS